MKKYLFLALLLIAPHLYGQTCTAASTSSAAVQTALNSCIAGGTVVIPSGSSTWSTTVSLAPTGPLTIVGANVCTGGCTAGSGGTSLAFTNNTNITLANATAGLQIGPCSSTAFCDVSEIHFLPTVAASNGAVQIQGTHGQVSFRVHHLQADCSLGTGVDLFLYNGYGLVDHYLANDTSSAGTECTPINMGGDLPTAGAQNWTDATNIGTNQSIILEDSNFTSTNGGSTEGVFDSYYGCKVTLRHNTFTNFELGGWHGTDSGGFRSCVLGEIYNNSITNSSGVSMQLMNTRGGTLLLSNNTVGGSTAWTPIDLQYFRVLGQNHSAQWGTGAAGLNWIPISATPTNALSDVVTLNAPDWQASHSYTCSSGSPCLIGPLLHNAGTGVSGAGGYNYEATANCVSSGTEPNPWNQTFPAGTQSDGTCTWTNVGGGTTAGPGGSGFLSTNPDTPCSSGGSCTRFLDASGGYPFRDQPGRVHDQVLAPNYAWSNTLPGSLSASTLLGTDSATASIIQSGTDYFNATAMPGYTPYTYPDPLQGTTWHILTTGGTATQCTGLVNAAYSGSGSAQPCAFSHPFWLMNTSTGAWSLLQAGDTIEFDDIGPYYIGQTLNGLGSSWAFCAGNESQCFMPPFPTGVTVKGFGFGACHNSSDPFWNNPQGNVPQNLINATQLVLLNRVAFGASFDSTNGVTFGCFHITQPDTCSKSQAQQFNIITNSSMTSGIATYNWTANGAYPAVGEFSSVSGSTNGLNYSHRQILSVTGAFTPSGTFTVGGFTGANIPSAADTATQTWDGLCTAGVNNYGLSGIEFAFSTDQGPSNLTLEDVAVEGIGSNGTFGSHFNTFLNITSVANASGGSTVYTGTFPACGSNACAGKQGVFQEFTHSANGNTLASPTFTVSASTTTTLTTNNPSGVAETTTTGLVSFDKVTISYLYLFGNASAGFNSDTGGGNTAQENVGQLLVDHMAIIANGCAAVAGASTYLGNGFNWCSAQPYNGYGDGLVLIASKGYSKFDTIVANYNTQDGFDGLHFGDDLASQPMLQVNHAFAYGNAGQTLKGGGGHVKFQNSIGITNCNLLGVASNFPGNPAGWNALIGVGNPGTCRASDGMAFAMADGDDLELDDITNIVDSVDSGIDIAKAGSGDCTSAATCIAIMRNVANYAFANPLTGIPAGGLSVLTTVDPFSNPGSSITHNSWFGFRSAICPQDPSETSAVCTDPKFTAESTISTMNIVPGATSPLIGAGTSYTGISAKDFFGVNLSSPPPIGAAMQSITTTPTTGFGTFKMLGTVHIP